MTLKTKRIVIAALSVTFLASLLLVQWMEVVRKREEAGLAPPHVVVQAESRDCVECHAHLRHCRNCMFLSGYSCLLDMPFRWPAAGLPGQDCPEFLWRDDAMLEAVEPLDPVFPTL